MKITPNIYAQVGGNEAIIAMVSMGCGIGVIPELVLEKSSLKDRISVLPGSPDLGYFTVGVCTRAKNRQRPTVKHFWEIARQVGSDVSGS